VPNKPPTGGSWFARHRYRAHDWRRSRATRITLERLNAGTLSRFRMDQRHTVPLFVMRRLEQLYGCTL
jgi:hypothetical protein